MTSSFNDKKSCIYTQWKIFMEIYDDLCYHDVSSIIKELK